MLAYLGDKRTFETHLGPLDVYLMADRYLLQYRPKWSPLHTDDFFDVWAFVDTYWNIEGSLSRTILVVDDQAHVRSVYVHDAFDADERVSLITHQLGTDPPGRLNKMTQRAMTICRFCPVQAACDAEDRLRGLTADWHPDYDR